MRQPLLHVYSVSLMFCLNVQSPETLPGTLPETVSPEKSFLLEGVQEAKLVTVTQKQLHPCSSSMNTCGLCLLLFHGCNKRVCFVTQFEGTVIHSRPGNRNRRQQATLCLQSGRRVMHTLGLRSLSHFIHLKAPAHGMVPPAVLETPSQTRPETSFRVFFLFVCFLPLAVDLPVIFMEKENPFSASLLPLLKDKPCCTCPHGRGDVFSMGLLCLRCQKVRAGADGPISAGFSEDKAALPTAPSDGSDTGLLTRFS